MSAYAEIAGWIAPAATMLAAMMTAANLGARITGYGFVVFTVGSIAWSAVAIGTGQQNLLWTNGLLTVVNIIGVWRWLGREARYEEGGQRAGERSAVAPAPTLTPIGALHGAKLIGANGEQIGTVVEAMLRCADGALAYVVVREGGVGGLGERLHALDSSELTFFQDHIAARLTGEELARRPLLEKERWPIASPHGARK